MVGWGGLGMMTFFAVALALGKHRWKTELVSGFGKKTFVLSNTELQADLQSHVLLGHRDLDTA